MVKMLSTSQRNKNFTVRIHPDVADEIRARAHALRMSQSYYISHIFKLEQTYDLVNQFPDPLAEVPAEAEDSNEGEPGKQESTALDPDEAAAMIERLKSAGFIPVANVEAPPVSPGIPPLLAPGPQRPVMRTQADLVRLSQTGGGAELQDALSGNVGNVQMEIRRRQLRETQEERQDQTMRKKILDGLEEEEDGTD